MRIVDPPAVEPTPVARAIAADDLAAAFEENAVAAEHAFVWRVLLVTGTVASMHRARGGGLVLTMLGSIFGSVACSFNEEAFDELGALRRAQRVVVEGTVAPGRGLTVRLRECRIVGPAPAGAAVVVRRVA